MNKKFLPGERIWIVKRDSCGNVENFYWYTYLSSVGDFAIASDFVCGCNRVEETLQFWAEVTAEDNDANIYVFPIMDCYKTMEESEKAFDKEFDKEAE